MTDMPSTYQTLRASDRAPLTEATVARLRTRDSLADVAELAAKRLRRTHPLRRAVALLALSVVILALPLVLVVLADGDGPSSDGSAELGSIGSAAAPVIGAVVALVAVFITGLVGYLSRRAEARRDEEAHNARHWDDRYVKR